MISATIDSSRRGDSERWHVQRQGGGPLCHASLSGRVRTARRATTNCNQCQKNDEPERLGPNELETLEKIDAGELFRMSDKRVTWYLHTLADFDYVRAPKEYATVTERGQVVLADLRNPTPWYDAKTKILHARRRLSASTVCGVVLGDYVSTYTIKRIAEKAKELGRVTVNCLECATRMPR